MSKLICGEDVTDATQPIIFSSLPGEGFPRLVLEVGGTFSLGNGTFERDLWLYRGENGELNLGTARDNVDGCLSVGKLKVGILNVGANVLTNATSQSLAVGLNNDVNFNSNYNLVGGLNSVVTGYNSVSFGNNSRVLSDGECNFCLGSGIIQSGGSLKSNFSCVLGKGTISGSNSCYLVGAEGVTVQNNGFTSSAYCVVIGPGSGVVQGCEYVTMLGGNRNASGNSGNVILTSPSGTIVGAPATNNSLDCRMSGGYWFGTNDENTIGVMLAPGSSSWASVQDARVKEIIGAVQGGAGILDKLSEFEMFIDKKNVVGPTTQSFYKAFGEHLGKRAKTQKYTGAFDKHGRCLGKVAVNDEVELLDDRDEKTALWMICKELRKENKELKQRLDDLEEALGL